MKRFFWELRLLRRNRSFLVLLAVYTAAALLAIVAGETALQHSLELRSQVETHYQSELDQWRAQDEVIEAGYLGYYQSVPTAPVISPWAALFTGESPEHNWNLRVRLLALYGQLYASEIQHYDNTVLSGFDLGFLWVYLLPIIIGLLCVNIIADEKNSGRWPLLRGQARSLSHFLYGRLTIYFLLLALLNGAILLFATAMLDITVDRKWAAIFKLLLVYQFFWFAVATAIARGERSAGFNVLSYSGVWLTAAFLLPGLHYLKQMNSEELDTGIAIVMEQREQMNDSWDRDKNADFAQFLQKNPQWRHTTPLPEAFHWKWYYAMQDMSDAAVQKNVETLKELRVHAYQIANRWAWLSPVMSFQQSLNSAAGTHGRAHQDYLDKVTEYHGQLKAFYYPHYFFEQPFPREKLSEIPRMQHALSTDISPWGVIQLFVACAIASVLLMIGTKSRHSGSPAFISPDLVGAQQAGSSKIAPVRIASATTKDTTGTKDTRGETLDQG